MGNKALRTYEAKRGLRRKPNQDDANMRKLKIEPIENFKQKVLFGDDFMKITSHAQIKAIQALFISKAD